MSEVVRLIDRAPGFSPDSPDGLFEWARNWIDGLSNGDYGDIKSLVLVVEAGDGRMAQITQSMGYMDRARLVGVLHAVAHSVLDGHGRIDELRE